jgi:hypothetical protein
MSLDSDALDSWQDDRTGDGHEKLKIFSSEQRTCRIMGIGARLFSAHGRR